MGAMMDLSNVELSRDLMLGDIVFITYSAVILYADWSIGVRTGVVHTCRFNIERQNSIIPLGYQPIF